MFLPEALLQYIASTVPTALALSLAILAACLQFKTPMILILVLIYLLTENGLTPVGSSAVHICTQNTRNNTINNFG